MNKLDKRGAQSANTLAEFYQSSKDYQDMLARRPKSDFDNFVRLVIRHVPPNSLVLELGSGTGQAAVALRASGREVVASDISPLFLAGSCLARLPTIAADTRTIPFCDETFDAVISNEVIEYVTEIALSLLEMARVTRMGGLVIIRAPQLASPIWPILDLPDLLRGGGRPPHYTDFRSATRFFLNNCVRSIRIAFSKNQIFHWREPDLSRW